MPDEIDGDDRLGISRSSFHRKRPDAHNFSLTESTEHEWDPNAQRDDMNQSVYISKQEGDSDGLLMRRYSVIGNDPAFKQYTKNHDYDTLKYHQ